MHRGGINTKEEKSHKFQEIRGETYEQLFRIRYGELVQLAAAFKQVLGKEKTLQIIEELYDKIGIDTIKRVKEMVTIENFDDFAEYFKNSLKDPFFSHVLTATIEEETSQKLSLKITECLFAKTFADMNASELGYVIACNPDFSMAKTFHPNITLKRTKTLMQGDECCDFTYFWGEEMNQSR